MNRLLQTMAREETRADCCARGVLAAGASLGLAGWAGAASAAPVRGGASPR